MDVLETWYARLDEADFLAMLPGHRRAGLQKRIDKATARSGSELVFPKLVETTAGQHRIHDSPPTIFHLDPAIAAGNMEMPRQVLPKYRETGRAGPRDARFKPPRRVSPASQSGAPAIAGSAAHPRLARGTHNPRDG